MENTDTPEQVSGEHRVSPKNKVDTMLAELFSYFIFELRETGLCVYECGADEISTGGNTISLALPGGTKHFRLPDNKKHAKRLHELSQATHLIVAINEQLNLCGEITDRRLGHDDAYKLACNSIALGMNIGFQQERFQRTIKMNNKKRPPEELAEEAIEALAQAKNDFPNLGLVDQKKKAMAKVGLKSMTAFNTRLNPDDGRS